MMEWEKMLEEYFAMLESFSGMALFERAAQAEGEAAGKEAERMRWAGDGAEKMRLGGGAVMEMPRIAADGELMEAVERYAVPMNGGAEMEDEVSRMEERTEMEAAGPRMGSGNGPADAGRLERWWSEAAGGLFQGTEAAAGRGMETAVYREGGREPAGDALREAAQQLMPEESGLAFRPAEPPEWRDGLAERPAFLWQAAIGRENESAPAGGGERTALFSGSRKAEAARGREEDGVADRILDELEARLMLEIGSGAEGYYR